VIDMVLIVAGVGLIAVALADLINTLVSTSTSPARWWPTRVIGRSTFVALRSVARRLPEDSHARERMMAAFAPLLVIALLATWAVLQIMGFALIWFTLDDIDAIGGFGDSLYYSGVVYFTVGFGEIVPVEAVPRAGALIEAFFGVITMALVIGYLPTLYAAYSDRERRLITLDAGGTERITPTQLVMAWAPDADPKKIDAEFEKWEEWAAGILETHSTVPLLVLFRSHDRRQNWVTALGLLCDAALHAQMIMGATDGNAFWFLRRAEAIFREVTQGYDLAPYERVMQNGRNPEMFRALYDQLSAHGFRLRPYEEAAEYTRQARMVFAPALEFLIDDLLCPRGFWPLDSTVVAWSSEHAIPRYGEWERQEERG
jgi:hypothetical protein